MRLEQLHDAARFDVIEAARQHAHHRALVVFVGAEHVEEFQAHPLRRQLLAVRCALGDGEIEQVLAPAVEIHRPQFLQRRDRGVVVKSRLAVAIGRGRGGVDQRLAGSGAPAPQRNRGVEVGRDDVVGVALGGRGVGAEMEHRLDLVAEAFEPGGEPFDRHDLEEVALGDVAPFVARAEPVDDNEIGAAQEKIP